MIAYGDIQRAGNTSKTFKNTKTRSACMALFRWKNSHNIIVLTRIENKDTITITYDR
jgi:hypothetical protein